MPSCHNLFSVNITFSHHTDNDTFLARLSIWKIPIRRSCSMYVFVLYSVSISFVNVFIAVLDDYFSRRLIL